MATEGFFVTLTAQQPWRGEDGSFLHGVPSGHAAPRGRVSEQPRDDSIMTNTRLYISSHPGNWDQPGKWALFYFLSLVHEPSDNFNPHAPPPKKSH